MSLTTTSCEGLINEDALSIITQLLGTIFQQGTANNYTGTAKCQYLYGTYSDASGFQASGQTDIQPIECTLQASSSNGCVTVQLPSITVTKGEQSATINNVTIYNMQLAEDGTLSLSDNTTIDGNIVAPDGNTYKLVYPYVISASISGSNLQFNASLYFGEDYSRVMNVNFTGALATTTAQ